LKLPQEFSLERFDQVIMDIVGVSKVLFVSGKIGKEVMYRILDYRTIGSQF
jgi:hypothetical protein